MAMAREADQAERRCIVSGDVLPKEALLRFVIGPDGSVVPDLDAKLPGRGLWLRAERDIIRAACTKGAFSRAARCEAHAPSDLAGDVERLLRRRSLELIGLARRSGALVVGFEAVRKFLVEEPAGALLAASDGADDGRNKVRALAPDVPIVDVFDGQELGAAVGRDHVVHGVLAKGRLAERIVREASRFAGVVGMSTQIFNRTGMNEGT
jgi:predicted RNA-binding protein YlxR (DUF448 family)